MDSQNRKMKATQVGLHSVKNILGNQQQIDLFGEHHKEFCEEYDVKLEGTIDRFGIDLTEVQSRIMEGILYGFSRTSYKGNVDSTSKKQLASQRFSGKIPDSYKYIQEIPKIKVSQSELLEWSGINKNSIASWSRAVEAIQELGKKQYCFYYDRLALDDNGTPIKDRSGSWVKEEVFSVDTLFSIKEIREKNSGSLKYYEIMPSSIFLDQRDRYFMFIPLNWREEVKELMGNKKASSYTFRFLLFLRYQYELKRRSKKIKPPYTIKWSPEEISMSIKMPPSIYLRKKKRANEILEVAYSVAKRLGYLSKYERTGYLDILILNDKKYFNNRSLSYSFTDALEEKQEKTSDLSRSLLEVFYTQKRKVDPLYQAPTGNEQDDHALVFQKLLKERPLEDVERLICWATSRKYWCSRLSTPTKIKTNFSEAWSEMICSSEFGKEQKKLNNKELAQKILQKIEPKNVNVRIDILNQYVEILAIGSPQSVCIHYDSEHFETSFKKALIKCNIEIK